MPRAQAAKTNCCRRRSAADDSGFLIVRFKPGTLTAKSRELAPAAKQAGLLALHQILEAFKIVARPLVTSLKSDELERLESAAIQEELPPLGSLSTYWQLDVRHVMEKIEEIEIALRCRCCTRSAASAC